MFERIINFFKKLKKSEKEDKVNSKDTAKERLHLVLMQDRANVSADFLELMKQEIIEVIKKYIDIDEKAIDVRLTNNANSDGTIGAPALYANIPITNIKNDVKSVNNKEEPKKVENTDDETIEENSKEVEENKVEENEKQDKIEEKEEIKEKEENNSESEEKKEENIEEKKNETV